MVFVLKSIHTKDRVIVKNPMKQDRNSKRLLSLKARSVKSPVFLVLWDILTKSIVESVALLNKSPEKDIKLLTCPGRWRHTQLVQ